MLALWPKYFAVFVQLRIVYQWLLFWFYLSVISFFSDVGDIDKHLFTELKICRVSPGFNLVNFDSLLPPFALPVRGWS